MCYTMALYNKLYRLMRIALLSAKGLMLLNCGDGEDSWESVGLQGDPTSPFWRNLVLNIHWKDWCWSWSSNTLAPWREELTHWKRTWCWKRLKAGEGDGRGWDGWMASLPQWTSLSRLRQLVIDKEDWRFVIHGVTRVRHDWAELNWLIPLLNIVTVFAYFWTF